MTSPGFACSSQAFVAISIPYRFLPKLFGVIRLDLPQALALREGEKVQIRPAPESHAMHGEPDAGEDLRLVNKGW